MSKVRFCYHSLRKNLDALRQKADEEIQSTSLKSKIESALNSLEGELISYLDKLSSYQLFLISEFLDSQTFPLLDSAKMRTVFESCEVFCSEEDYCSPQELDVRRRAAVQETRRRSRGIASREPEIESEEENFEAFLKEGLSTVSPIKVELGKFIPFVRALDANERNPLLFWANHGHKYPILCLLASKVLSGNVTSADVERLFSRGGLICSNLRASLKPMTVLILTSLHYFYREEESILDSRSITSTKKSTRFANLQMNLAIKDGDYNEDIESDSGSDILDSEEE